MRTLLVVDDDAHLVEALARQCRAHRGEWTVHTARGGREAMRMVAELDRIDVVVTDILMPEKDGLEVVMDLRRNHPEVMMIAMSGGGMHVGAERGEQIGRD